MNDKFSAADIEVITGLEAVRRRPAMYVGALDDPGVPTRLLRQALCHAVDEAADGTCTSIEIALGFGEAMIRYDAGLPLDVTASGRPAADVFLSALHACSNLKKHIRVGSEYCELGLAVLTAMCRRMEARIVSRQRTATIAYELGQCTEITNVTDSKEPDSTTLAFALDASILKSNVEFERSAIDDLARKLRSDFPVLTVDIVETGESEGLGRGAAQQADEG